LFEYRSKLTALQGSFDMTDNDLDIFVARRSIRQQASSPILIPGSSATGHRFSLRARQWNAEAGKPPR
jgi:hypothetical protein